MSQVNTQYPSSNLGPSQWMQQYAQWAQSQGPSQNQIQEQMLGGAYNNQSPFNPGANTFGTYSGATSGANNVPFQPGVGTGMFVQRGGITNQQAGFLFGALGRDYDLGEQQRQSILGEADRYRNVSQVAAGRVRQTGQQTAGALRGLSSELGEQAGPGGYLSQGVEQANLAANEFQRTAPEEIGAFTNAIQQRTRNELAAIESGQLPDGTVMTPEMQMAARAELSARVNAESAPVIAQMRTRQQETLAQLRLSAGQTAVQAGATQAEFGRIRAGLESQAADILNAAQLEATKYEVTGQAGYLATLQQTPPLSLLDGMLAIFNIGVAGGGRSSGGSSIGQAAAAIGPIVAAIAMCDRRLKRDIRQIGVHKGMGVYTYRFAWSDQMQAGLMADEVEKVVPEAVLIGPGGFKMVDYERAMR